jgi:carbonic anhydrase
MCSKCGSVSRRGLLLGGVAASVATAAGAHLVLASTPPAGSALLPADSLEKLKAGNARFIASPQTCAMDLQNRRASIAQRQAPWATVIGCADSRVPPELLFGGLGLGELFVARNAGNLVDTATLGTVEYGVMHLGSPLIVVLGHERCGAVAAACDVALKGTKHPGAIGRMIAPIVPVARDVKGRRGDFVDNTVRESARRTARRLTEVSDLLSEYVDDKTLMIVAAYYDLDTGKVEFLK